jgi:diacylglycerol kinase family enzyme
VSLHSKADNLDAPAAPWVAIQRNPMSGSGRRGHEILRLIEGLRKRSIRPRLFSDRSELDAAVTDPTRPGLLGIVAAGGDGTLLDVINRHRDLPVAVLPLGTENLFARSLGIRRSGEEVARIVAQGRLQRFDAAACNGRRFLVVASAGFDAEVIRLAHERRTGRISRVFYLRPILTALRHYRFPQMRVFLDDDPQPLSGALVVVANLAAYALRLPIAPKAVGDDGWLDVCVFERGGSGQLCRDLISVITRRHDAVSNIKTRRARRVRLEGDSTAPVQLDGDSAGASPVDIQIEPAALRVFVP